MRAYLDQPLPATSQDYRRAEYLALDLETTGLTPDADHILSVGFVPIIDQRIRLREARHLLVRADAEVAQSATIHHLTDTHLEAGQPLETVLAHVLEALAARVLLVHHAPFDVGFLEAACRQCYGVPLSVRVADTLALQRQRDRHRPHEQRDGALRLHALRHRYGLPRYPAHDALSDALATAELFLAITAGLAGDDRLPLRALLR
jgi:DNA polymerase-3 subunit epsilon